IVGSVQFRRVDKRSASTARRLIHPERNSRCRRQIVNAAMNSTPESSAFACAKCVAIQRHAVTSSIAIAG
ncbi:MAG TPA: hypothetical protein PLF25_05735, partial [Accumulibacter sp.]|nr:hypothetical protein [Accumulibacter sp.]